MRKAILAHPLGSAAAIILSSVAAGFLASYWDKLIFERFTAPLAQWTGEVAAHLVTTALVLTMAILLVGGAMVATAWLTWRIARGDVADEGDQAYWTLTEAVSWIAFGEAVTTQQWSALSRKVAVGLIEERHRYYVAERLLFEKLRNPDSGIDVQGKENGEGSHKPIPSNVFLSKIGGSILNDSLGMPHEADIGTILNWDGPNWTEVRIRRVHILKHWKTRANIQSVADDLGRLILGTRPIMDELQDHDSMPPTEAMQQWRSDAIEYIRSNMGRAYEARFTEPQTFSDEELGPLGRNPVNVLKVGLQHRIDLLHEFIDEAKTYMNPKEAMKRS